jgi:hypothetical protein
MKPNRQARGGLAVALRLAAVTVDCEDALIVARFWAAALDRPLDPKSSSDFASIGMADMNEWGYECPSCKTPKGMSSASRRPGDGRSVERRRPGHTFPGRYSRIGSVQDGAGFELFTPGRRANCVAHRRAKPGTEPTVSIWA